MALLFASYYFIRALTEQMFPLFPPNIVVIEQSESLKLNEKNFNTYTKEFDVVGDVVIKNTTWIFNVNVFS